MHRTNGGNRLQRVLIVDDNPDIRYLTRLTIESDSCQVVGEANNGVEALDLADDVRPDTVVIDLRMPLMDGIEATRILRYRFPDLKIIVLSGSDDPAVERQISAAGADVAVDKAKLDDLVIHLDAEPR